MSAKSVTLDLPEALYAQLEQRATQSHRTIEAELLHVVSSVVPMAGEFTAELSELLTQMEVLDDKTLWQAAHRRLSKRALAQMQSLNYKRQREGLTEAEAQKSNALWLQYEHIILIRAQAAKLLKERGHDISELVMEL